MRNFLAIAALSAVCCLTDNASASPDTPTDSGSPLVVCNSPLPGTASYRVDYLPATDDRPARYQLLKVPSNPTAEPLSLEVNDASVVRYGKTFILTLNQGRSGYAHLYFNGSTSVIDIDLFNQPDFNTPTPQTAYSCVVNVI